MQTIARTFVSVGLISLFGCTDGAVAEQSNEAIDSHGPTLVQAGSGIVILAVTSDDWAIYQQSSTVFATPLRAHAGAPLVVAEEPAGAQAFPLQVGKEVFLWTTPQRNLPGFGVSPLLLFTSKRGTQLLSTQSAVGLVATAASDDDKQILFTTNVDAPGAVGDIFLADTDDIGHATPLVQSVPMNFPFGPCRPLAIFVGGNQTPAAAYCPNNATTATLSTWKHGQRKDIIDGIALEMPFTLDANPQGDSFLVSLADGRIVTVSDEGKATTLDQGQVSRGAINRHGNAIYGTNGANGPDVRLSHRGAPGQMVSPLGVFLQDRVNRNGYAKSRLLSPDGSLALFSSILDPIFGVGNDMNLVNADTGEVFPLETGPLSFQNSEVFTEDSRYGFWLDFVNLNVGTGKLMSGSVKNGLRQLGPSTIVWDALRASGSRVTYNENPTFLNGQFGLLSTADLFVVDADHPEEAKLISRAANIQYLATPDRDRVVFGSEVEADGPGLYVARAR